MIMTYLETSPRSLSISIISTSSIIPLSQKRGQRKHMGKKKLFGALKRKEKEIHQCEIKPQRNSMHPLRIVASVF